MNLLPHTPTWTDVIDQLVIISPLSIIIFIIELLIIICTILMINNNTNMHY